MAAVVNSGVIARASWVQANTTTNLVGREDTDVGLGIALVERWKHPLLVMSKQLKKRSANTIDFHWFEDEMLPYQDTIFYSTGYSSSETAILVTTGERFRPGNLVRHVKSDEIFFVSSISSDTLTIVRDRGQANESWTAKAVAFVDSDYLEIIGSAYEQGHAVPEIRTTKEVERVNYIQEFRNPIGMTEVAEDTKTRGEQDMPYQRRKMAIQHGDDIELTFFWGKPNRGGKASYSSSTGNIEAAQTGGVNHFMELYADSSHKLDETDLTESEFIDFTEFIFEKGGDMKVCFCPPALRLGLDKWGISRQRTFEATTVLGIKAAKYQTSMGTVFFVTHQALKTPQSGQWNTAFILDMDEVQYVGFGRDGNTNRRDLDPYKATGNTIAKEEWKTNCGLQLKKPNYHGRLRFKTVSV